MALVGPSGSGKSTLSKLLLRLMDVDEGGILIDGQDIRDVTLASLRRHISYVPQDPQLLHRTIAENICYGLGARGGRSTVGGPSEAVDYDLVHRVGRAAHVEEFVYALPDGYDTMVGERGLKLSGGQRQRVAIAQAMAKRAPILVLDEATSALDSESEHLVQEALWRLMEDSTALVIAHRLSTIAHMDRIVVFDQGAIVQEGTHRELLDEGDDGMYGRLWQHQSGRVPGRVTGAARTGLPAGVTTHRGDPPVGRPSRGSVAGVRDLTDPTPGGQAGPGWTAGPCWPAPRPPGWPPWGSAPRWGASPTPPRPAASGRVAPSSRPAPCPTPTCRPGPTPSPRSSTSWCS